MCIYGDKVKNQHCKKGHSRLEMFMWQQGDVFMYTNMLSLHQQ